MSGGDTYILRLVSRVEPLERPPCDGMGRTHAQQCGLQSVLSLAPEARYPLRSCPPGHVHQRCRKDSLMHPGVSPRRRVVHLRLCVRRETTARGYLCKGTPSIQMAHPCLTRAQRGSSSETPAPQDLKRVPTWVTTPDGWCWKAVRVELTKPHMQQHSGPSAALIRRRGEAALPRGAIEHGKYRRQERALGESQIRRVQRSRRSRREAASLCRQGRRRQVTRRQGRRPMEQR